MSASYSPVRKIGIITSHPIQYQVPLFRAIAKEPDMDLTVFFGSNHGITPKVDPGFGKAFAWDIPLLEGYRYIFLNNSRPGLSVNDWRLDGPELKFYFEKEHYDAVLIFGWNKMLFWQAVWWGRKFRIPLILRAESNLMHRQNRSVRMAKHILFPLLFRKFSAFLAIGQLNKELYRHFGVPEEKIFSAPYCVDNDFFSERAKASEVEAVSLRKSLGIRGSDTVFLFIAKLIERKRPLDLIRAHHLLGGRKDVHTILVGAGLLFGKCASLVRELGLNNVHLVGFMNQTELPLYYSASDILVLPSDYETWGLVVNEAMACGLPCIVSNNCGCAADMIVPGKTGYTYPCGNVAVLVKTMGLLGGNREKLLRMGRSARIFSREFGIDRTVVALKEALVSINGR